MTYVIKTDRGWMPFHALNAPCSNSNDLKGVYRPENIEKVRAALSSRADRFAFVLEDEQTGDRCGIFVEPIYGAFGEKL